MICTPIKKHFFYNIVLQYVIHRLNAIIVNNNNFLIVTTKNIHVLLKPLFLFFQLFEITLI